MTTITPDDAYGLALIAKDPASNKDLVESLSAEARPIGNELLTPKSNVDPSVCKAAEALRNWAQGNKKA